MAKHGAPNRIREIRQSKKMTLTALAGYVDISIAYLSDIEKGNRHGTEPVRKRADDGTAGYGQRCKGAVRMLVTDSPQVFAADDPSHGKPAGCNRNSFSGVGGTQDSIPGRNEQETEAGNNQTDRANHRSPA